MHVHGDWESLVSGNKAVTTFGGFKNVMSGGVLAEMTGGLVAGVKSLGFAELAAYWKSEVKAMGGVEVTCDRGIEVVSRHAGVEVLGKSIDIGKAELGEQWKTLGKKSTTKRIQLSAAVLDAEARTDAGRTNLHLSDSDMRVRPRTVASICARIWGPCWWATLRSLRLRTASRWCTWPRRRSTSPHRSTPHAWCGIKRLSSLRRRSRRPPRCRPGCSWVPSRLACWLVK